MVVVLIVIALVSTVGWTVSARGTATANQTAGAASEAKPHGHSGANAANGLDAHAHGGTAQNSPPMAPRDGVVAMTVPRLPKTAVNFIWKPQHLQVAAGEKVTLKVANADYMQHNFTFKPAKVAKNLPVDAHHHHPAERPGQTRPVHLLLQIPPPDDGGRRHGAVNGRGHGSGSSPPADFHRVVWRARASQGGLTARRGNEQSPVG